ncbi:MAG: hypothetical protein RLP44_27415 [Aggregatilineales bacterium]
MPFTFFLGLFDSGFFRLGESVIIPVNGRVISVVITLLMIVSVVLVRAFFQRRGWS